MSAEWRAPRCPGCDEPPRLHFGGSQAFCGNDNCRVIAWERDGDPALFKDKTQVVDLDDLGDDHD